MGGTAMSCVPTMVCGGLQDLCRMCATYNRTVVTMVTPSQPDCQANLRLTGGRHSSYRPALVFPSPEGAAPPQDLIWHPAILWCVPPSFGVEMAGMGETADDDAMVPWHVHRFEFRPRA